MHHSERKSSRKPRCGKGVSHTLVHPAGPSVQKYTSVHPARPVPLAQINGPSGHVKHVTFKSVMSASSKSRFRQRILPYLLMASRILPVQELDTNTPWVKRIE